MKKVKTKLPEQTEAKKQLFVKFITADTQGINTLGYTYVFDEDEKTELDKRLQGIKNLDPEKIKLFIQMAQRYCSSRKIIQNYPKNIRKNKEGILRICEDTLNYLNKVERGELWLAVCEKISNPKEPSSGTFKKYPPNAKYEFYDHKIAYLPEESRALAIMIAAQDRASAVIKPLKSFISLIELSLQAEEKKRGRKDADSTAFIKKLAEAYSRFIDKPTQYKYGPFYDIACICLEAAGLPSSDPSRAVKAALTALKNS